MDWQAKDYEAQVAALKWDVNSAWSLITNSSQNQSEITTEKNNLETKIQTMTKEIA